MGLTGKSNEQKIWNYLTERGLSPAGVAGLMGNLYAESGLRPNNLENRAEKELGMGDASYTAAVDDGSYTNFEKDAAGYGLAQWTYHTRKAALKAHADWLNVSIGDMEMQLDFLMKELSEGYSGLLNLLKTTVSVKDASDRVLTQYERPTDMSDAVKDRRAGYGQKYFDKYVSTTTSTAAVTPAGETAAQIRARVVARAKSWLGCKESDGSHKKIIDLYNSQKPLPVGYKVTYTDAWCDTFASAVAVAEDLTDIIPTECGCGRHIDLFKKMGRWVEDDAYVPSPGDYLFYDWQDSGLGDNTGGADHVGIVTDVDGNKITVIEGNKNDAVEYRTISVNGKYIRGYGVPDYESKATATSDTPAPAPATPDEKTVDELAKEVLAGLWGNGEDRKRRLTAAGYDYATVQARVNELCRATQKREWKIGDTVMFTGNTHFVSADARNGVSCKGGKATVTGIYKTGAHPYHLIRVPGSGATVYGWVNEADITEV